MKKFEQMKINAACVAFYKLARQEAEQWHTDFAFFNERTATCATDNFNVLFVHTTIGAIYYVKTGLFVDVLRLEYRYAPVCVQQIEKFRKLMLEQYGRCEVIRYYPL